MAKSRSDVQEEVPACQRSLLLPAPPQKAAGGQAGQTRALRGQRGSPKHGRAPGRRGRWSHGLGAQAQLGAAGGGQVGWRQAWAPRAERTVMTCSVDGSPGGLPRTGSFPRFHKNQSTRS